MTNAHKRKKDPDQVRRSILESATSLIKQHGFAALSLQLVANDAGITKGGLLHHFPNKKLLQDAIFTGMLNEADDMLDQAIANDSVAYGCFTRAYVYCFSRLNSTSSLECDLQLSISILSDPQMNAMWAEWLQKRLIRHAETDSSIDLEIIRFAADGLWLGSVCNAPLSDHQKILEHMLKSTLPPDNR